jgi:UDP-GlcNAc:undecaprenyl-phosphate GlcNAc-1-phosphate transferase
LVLLGTTLGFWAFNRPPASIFMGDSGSLFLGYALAVFSIWVTEMPGKVQTIIPLLILAIPILDTVFAFFRRILKGVPFHSADYDHLHHRLILKGFSGTQSMMILIGISSVFGVMALLTYLISDFFAYSFMLGGTLAYALLYWLGYDVIRSPYNSIKQHPEYRDNRNLMIALGKQVDEFFAKDPDYESVLRSFCFYIKLAGVSWFEVRIKNEIIFKNGFKEPSHRDLSFKQDNNEVRMKLPETIWVIDSDIKRDLIKDVSLSVMTRLEQLKSS